MAETGNGDMKEYHRGGGQQKIVATSIGGEKTELLGVRSARQYTNGVGGRRVIHVRVEPGEVTEVIAPRRVVRVKEEDGGDETELVIARPLRLYLRAVENECEIERKRVEEDREERAGGANVGEALVNEGGREWRKCVKIVKNGWRAEGREKRAKRLFVLSTIFLLAILLAGSVLYYSQLVRAQVVQREQKAQALQRMQVVQWQEQQRLQGEQDAEAYARQVKVDAWTAVQQYQQEVVKWGEAHLYSDSYDRKKYTYDSGYAQEGVGAFLSDDLKSAQSSEDYEGVIAEAQNDLFNLQMMEKDFGDRTTYNQVHKTDKQLLDRYKLEGKSVLVVSMVEQVLRVYQQGKLVRAFYVTTGRPERPSLPGVWPVLNRASPITFVSSDAPGSPFWFPNTPISYAINYHEGGFFFHDASWRVNFGPGTQFPHQDASGNTPYNFDGSHGCINLTTADAAWIYTNTNWGTQVLIY